MINTNWIEQEFEKILDVVSGVNEKEITEEEELLAEDADNCIYCDKKTVNCMCEDDAIERAWEDQRELVTNTI